MRVRDDEVWVMSCGAKDHKGWQRHSGALVTWRRNLHGYRKCNRKSHPNPNWWPNDTPDILKRSRMGLSDLNRRIIPAEYKIGYGYPDGYWLVKHRGKPMVLGRGQGGFDGGPVGKHYRV